MLPPAPPQNTSEAQDYSAIIKILQQAINTNASAVSMQDVLNATAVSPPPQSTPPASQQAPASATSIGSTKTLTSLESAKAAAKKKKTSYKRSFEEVLMSISEYIFHFNFDIIVLMYLAGAMRR